MSERDAVERPQGLIVAIDGPAGAGKSTVAAHLARQFGLLNLETGAMYRAFALKAIAESLSLDDAAAMTGLSARTSIVLKPGESGNTVLLDGEEVTAKLRLPEVTAAASRVSVHPAVRAWMVAEQRAMGLRVPSGVVMEGRDIGTAVFPDAAVKIFLDASMEARGGRRFLQQGAAETATGAASSRQEIVRQIAERDQRDRERAASPLRRAADAIVIDTTSLSLDEVLVKAAELVAAAQSQTS